MKRITCGSGDFSDLISSCTSIWGCPAVPVDSIMIIVRRNDEDGIVWKSIFSFFLLMATTSSEYF